MKIVEREPGDIAELTRRAGSQKRALRRDRYRAVLMALDGQKALAIAAKLGRAGRGVQDWAYAYRDHGIDALIPRKQPGKPPKLSAEQQQQLRARLDAGPRASDGVCTLRGKDVIRIVQEEFGVKHTIGSIYSVLHRLGYSCLCPRPRHKKNDPAAIEQFKRDAPPFCPEPEAGTRQQDPCLVYGRGPIRTAGNQHPYPGGERLAADGGSPNPLRMGLPLRRGRTGQR